jgi:hypothetical protein
MSTVLFVVGILDVLVGMIALVVVFRILRSALRSERRGNERVEMLREQQERLAYLHRERELLLEELRQERGPHAEIERAWRESSAAQDNG